MGEVAGVVSGGSTEAAMGESDKSTVVLRAGDANGESAPKPSAAVGEAPNPPNGDDVF